MENHGKAIYKWMISVPLWLRKPIYHLISISFYIIYPKKSSPECLEVFQTSIHWGRSLTTHFQMCWPQILRPSETAGEPWATDWPVNSTCPVPDVQMCVLFWIENNVKSQWESTWEAEAMIGLDRIDWGHCKMWVLFCRSVEHSGTV